MARPTNTKKGKESLENVGVKVDPSLKKAIEEESSALGVTAGTYARQLLITGWQARHQAPIAKNPRELILIELFNDLPIGEQENVVAMVEALHKKHVPGTRRIVRLDKMEDLEKLGGPHPVRERDDN